jgi:hypothetical protein
MDARADIDHSSVRATRKEHTMSIDSGIRAGDGTGIDPHGGG